MNALAQAIIGQLKAIGDAVRQDDWSADELHALLNVLYEVAGNVQMRLAHKRRHHLRDGGGAA
jgi:hypothetical protein